jgi:hypothetical protein
LPDGQLAGLVGLFLCAHIALGEDDLDRLHEGHLVAHGLGLVQGAAQAKGLAHGQGGIGKPALAITLPSLVSGFRPNTWSAAPASSSALPVPGQISCA